LTYQDAFSVLGIDPQATPDEIDRAYRAQALRVHPDAGGSAEAFTRLAQAHRAAREHASRRSALARVVERPGWSSVRQLVDAAPAPAAPLAVFKDVEIAAAQACQALRQQTEAELGQARRQFASEFDRFSQETIRRVRQLVHNCRSTDDLRKVDERLRPLVQDRCVEFARAWIARAGALRQRLSELARWVRAVRTVRFEHSLPHRFWEFAGRAGFLASMAVLTITIAAAGIATASYLLPGLWYGPASWAASVACLAGGALAAVRPARSIYLSGARYFNNWQAGVLLRSLNIHEAAFAFPAGPDGLDREERATTAALLGGAAWWLLALEPLTGGLILAATTVIGWLTGPSFERLRDETTERAVAVVEPVLADFRDQLDQHLMLVLQDEFAQVDDAYQLVMRTATIRP